MPLVETNTGTQTAVISTVHTLATPTPGKTYVLHLDLSVMQAADVLNIFIRTKAKSGGTMRTMMSLTLAGVQAAPNFMTIPVPSVNGIDFQIQQTGGTGRAYDWSIQSLD